ncbi:hypothetical protein [Actinocrispum wychmicini]|uniref:Uncharacterized protein n=1 Tax=Actinocrispum wychmicini TaxID=1213861 RepID=A0A4R2JM66_9PSEU|nr:hypothetical protein [Actinocrispum wychmicini]TCO58206.1 hypothetical protein EV192_105271 [Actinocrispum wychmicini]
MRNRLHTVIVALLLIAGCSSSDHNQPETSGNAAATPDEWASMRSIDACAILDETALAPLGKVSDKQFAGASVHSCVATITAPDSVRTTARAFVGERAAPDAKQLDLAGVPAVQDSSCAVTVKVAGDDGISISVGGYEFEKQCEQAQRIATAVRAQLKTPPQNPYSTPFHGRDPCQPVDRLAHEIGTVKSLRRPTIINCEMTGSSGSLLISQEIINVTSHQHGEPLTIAGKEGMRHQEPDQQNRCMVMVRLRDAPQDSYYSTQYEVSSTSDPCGKATNAANESATEG